MYGSISNLILNVGEEQAEEEFKWWLDNFGDDFYVEINRHGLEEEDHVNNVLIKFCTNNNTFIKLIKLHDLVQGGLINFQCMSFLTVGWMRIIQTSMVSS